MREYRVYRDYGSSTSLIDQQVGADELNGLYYKTNLNVTNFPPGSLSKRFRFIVKAVTDYAVDGIASDISDSMILADRPDKPTV